MEENPLNREPDVETPSFKLWQVSGDEKPDFKSLMEFNLAEGEVVHEIRQYASSVVSGYGLTFISKKKGEQYWTAVRGQRPDGSTFITASNGPLSLKEYEELIQQLEAEFRVVYDTDNPKIIPGRHVMLYSKPQPEK